MAFSIQSLIQQFGERWFGWPSPLLVLDSAESRWVARLRRAFPGVEVTAKVSLQAVLKGYAGDAWCSYVLKDPRTHSLIAAVEPAADSGRTAEVRQLLGKHSIPVLAWPSSEQPSSRWLRARLAQELTLCGANYRPNYPLSGAQRVLAYGLLTAAAVLGLYSLSPVRAVATGWFDARPMPQLALDLMDSRSCAAITPKPTLEKAKLEQALETLYLKGCVVSERPRYAGAPTTRELLAWFSSARTRLVPEERCRPYISAIDRIELGDYSEALEQRAVTVFDEARLNNCQVSPWQVVPPA